MQTVESYPHATPQIPQTLGAETSCIFVATGKKSSMQCDWSFVLGMLVLEGLESAPSPLLHVIERGLEWEMILMKNTDIQRYH